VKNKLLIVLALFLAMQFATGCAMVTRSPLTGTIYTGVKGPEAVGTGVASKSGEACATSILGIVAVGDASIEAARRAGGINEVAYVDYSATSILGVYASYCTQVRGR